MEEEAKKILKNCWVMTTKHKLDDENMQLKHAIQVLLKTNEDLQKSVDQIFEDYQDAGQLMFAYSETLDEIKNF